MIYDLEFMSKHENAEIQEALEAVLMPIPLELQFLQQHDVVRFVVDVKDCEGLPDGPTPVMLTVVKRHLVFDGGDPRLVLFLDWV